MILRIWRQAITLIILLIKLQNSVKQIIKISQNINLPNIKLILKHSIEKAIFQRSISKKDYTLKKIKLIDQIQPDFKDKQHIIDNIHQKKDNILHHL
jgi:hypothetical protein